MRTPDGKRCAVGERRPAFTLVELLVVIGIVAVLMAILLPSLSLARKAAETAVCASNIHQLHAASMIYAQDNGGYWPPAHYYFVTQNLHRWHGTRPNAASPFDFDGSPLLTYLQTARVKLCPSFIFNDTTTGFERSCGGYGYNDGFLGSGVSLPENAGLSLPIAQYEAVVDNVPAKMSQVQRPSAKIAFTDAAIANPALIEYSFAEPPLDADGNQNSPSIHFRHRGRANICWADGHVTPELMEWTYATNVYGADNRAMGLGYFGPHDDTLFQRN